MYDRFYAGFHTGASGGALDLLDEATPTPTSRFGGDADANTDRRVKIRIRHVKLSPGARSDFERIQEAMAAVANSDLRFARSYEESIPSAKVRACVGVVLWEGTTVVSLVLHIRLIAHYCTLCHESEPKLCLSCPSDRISTIARHCVCDRYYSTRTPT